MFKNIAGHQNHIALSTSRLLTNGEIVVIVDDDPSIRTPLRMYLEEQGLAVEETGQASELQHILSTRKVALVLLDIGLPDKDGYSLLPALGEQYPDVSIIMLTGVADLQTALDCIRKGADDYLSKPVKFNEILLVVRKVLEKRRLIFENRKYQEDLEKAHFRIQLMHQLSLKMNTVYLSTVELDEILQAILVGITANEGLRFNRAFLALFDEEKGKLQGKLAIGTTCRERAAKVWDEMRDRKLSFLEIIQNMRDSCSAEDYAVNQIIRSLSVPSNDENNILVRSALTRRSVRVSPENGCIPILLERRSLGIPLRHKFPEHLDRRFARESEEPLAAPDELINLLKEDNFVVVPLYSPGRPYGVIIADNFVTRQAIPESHVNALELFASQASLAIEHSHLYMEMESKIQKLQELNHELDKNKDMLVAAERYSALGQMAAQMVHVIRNPITSIGGVARILARKVSEPEYQKYLSVMIKETARLESTLEDLFDFVSQTEFHKEPTTLFPLINKTLMLVQASIEKQNINLNIQKQMPDPTLLLDASQIQRMLLHLLRNAVEAMPKSGELFVIIRQDGGDVCIVIQDTGGGIVDSHLDRARDSFFTTKTYGTGMGLTLVDRIVKEHGGCFELNNREKGLEVTVRLPLASEVTEHPT